MCVEVPRRSRRSAFLSQKKKRRANAILFSRMHCGGEDRDRDKRSIQEPSLARRSADATASEPDLLEGRKEGRRLCSRRFFSFSSCGLLCISLLGSTSFVRHMLRREVDRSWRLIVNSNSRYSLLEASSLSHHEAFGRVFVPWTCCTSFHPSVVCGL